MTALLRRFAIPASLLVLVACSSKSSSGTQPGRDSGASEDGGGGGDATTAADAQGDAKVAKDWSVPNPTTVAAFCPDLLGAEAEHEAACVGGPAAAWYVELTAGDACKKLGDAVTAGRVKFDPTKTQTCLEAFAKFTCADGDDQGLPTECKDALSGTVAQGTACYADLDCSGEGYCAGVDQYLGSCSGKCTARVAAGASCKLGEQCVDGYTCYSATSGKDAGIELKCNKTLTFKPGVAKGDACGHDATTKKTVGCLQGLSCDKPTHVCVPTVKLGAACSDGAGECERFTNCDPITRKCKQYPGAGGDCGYSSGQDIIGCLGQAYCKTSSSNPYAGTCANQGDNGAACVAAEQCVTARCKKEKDAGAGTCTASCTEE
jgi:hypothetical protein